MEDGTQLRTYTLYYVAFLAAIIGAWVLIDWEPYEYTALDVLDVERGTAPIYLAWLYLRFTLSFILLVVVPGVALNLLLRKVAGDSGAFALISTALGLILFVLVNYVLQLGRVSFLYYGVVALALVYLLKQRAEWRDRLWRPTTIHRIVSFVLLGVLLALMLREILYVRIFDIDEYYRGYFVLAWQDYRPFENLLYYGGTEIRYYTLLEYFAAVFGRLSGIEALAVYYWVFPLFLILGVLYAVIWLVQHCTSSSGFPWPVLFVPLLFYAFVSFDSYVFLNTMIRQTVNGLFLLILAICLYAVYRSNSSRAIYYLLFCLSFILLLGAKLLPALIAIVAFALIELFNRDVKFGYRVLRVASLLVVSYLFTLALVSVTEVEMTLTIDPFENHVHHNSKEIYGRLAQIAGINDQIPHYRIFVSFMYHLLVYNVQLVTALVALYLSLGYILGVDFKRPVPHTLPLLFLLFSGNAFCSLVFTIQSNWHLGFPENYWRSFALYSLSILTLLLLFEHRTKLRKLKPALPLLIVPLLFLYSDNVHEKGFHFIEDKDLIDISKYIAEHESTASMIVHNLQEGRAGAYVPLFARRPIYVSFTEYGGVMGQPGLDERLEELNTWFRARVVEGEPRPFPEPVENVLLLYRTSADSTIALDDSEVVTRVGDYILVRL